MRAFYTGRYVLPLPVGHRFPMIKYARLRERCLAEGVLRPDELAEPPAAAWDELALVHEPAYLAAARDGTLTALEQRRIGFPWSPEMIERSRRSSGATIAAARTALDEAAERGWGIAVNLAGGTPGYSEIRKKSAAFLRERHADTEATQPPARDRRTSFRLARSRS